MALLETIEVQVGSTTFNDVNAAFDFLAERSRKVLGPGMTIPLRRELLKTLWRAHGEMAKTHGGSWNGKVPTGVDHLFKRTGKGLADIYKSIKASGSFADEMTGEMRITGFMALHETGGRITRKRAQYMTIPLPAALDARGLPLKPSARDWPNTFVARSRAGNLLIFQRRGRSVVPLYLLRTSVVMPARLRTQDHIEGQLPYFEEKLFERISEALEKF